VLSADLARAGFTGASRILEGGRGFFAAMSEVPDASRVTDGLGDAWKIGENGYKLHACCGHTHSAIDVAIGMRNSGGWSREQALADIYTVDVETYGPGYEIVREMNPQTPYQAKFSMAYCVAAALLEGQVGLEQFAEDRFNAVGVSERAIARLLPRIRVQVASDLTAQYPAAWPTRVALTLRGRTTLEGAAQYPLGNAENPVDTGQLEAKMAGLLEPRFGMATARAAQDAIDALPECADMATLFRTLLHG
jgi:2-methylcitrate dehydratase PrpD